MANLQRIRTGSTGSLTPLERESLYELVKEYNSDFRVKTAAVPFVGDIPPESGACVISDHDGRMYYADEYGWHISGAAYSPIIMFVRFDGATQFSFRFKLPVGQSIMIYDGDGTATEVAGQDDTIVLHETNYQEAGNYTFFVLGDTIGVNWIRVNDYYGVSGSIDGWALLPDLTAINVNRTVLSGSIDRYADKLAMTVIDVDRTNIGGNLESLKNLINLEFLYWWESNVVGEVSVLSNLSSLAILNGSYSKATFNNVVTWVGAATFIVDFNNWTSKMVDNCLISLNNGGLANAAIRIIEGNSIRTSESDAAYDSLIAAGCTIT